VFNDKLKPAVSVTRFGTGNWEFAGDRCSFILGTQARRLFSLGCSIYSIPLARKHQIRVSKYSNPSYVFVFCWSEKLTVSKVGNCCAWVAVFGGCWVFSWRRWNRRNWAVRKLLLASHIYSCSPTSWTTAPLGHCLIRSPPGSVVHFEVPAPPGSGSHSEVPAAPSREAACVQSRKSSRLGQPRL